MATVKLSCFSLGTVCYRRWRLSQAGMIGQNYNQLFSWIFFLMDLIGDRHLEFCSPRLKKKIQKPIIRQAAVADLLVLLRIFAHAVWSDSTLFFWLPRGGVRGGLVLCDGGPLCVASSHAGADESLCLECYSANANLHRSRGVPQHERHSSASTHLFRSAKEESVLAPWYQTIHNIFLNDLKKVIFLPAAWWPTLLRQKL